jgi:hypothetical protein
MLRRAEYPRLANILMECSGGDKEQVRAGKGGWVMKDKGFGCGPHQIWYKDKAQDPSPKDAARHKTVFRNFLLHLQKARRTKGSRGS